ncbi:MAG: DNA-processing protein DprA [Saprospiraceae bacterium]
MTPYFYEIALSKILNIGPILAKSLISYCGSAEAVFKEKKSKLQRIPNIGPITIDQINLEKVVESTEKEIDFCSKNNIQILYFLESNYPSRLKHFPESPIILYYKGTADLNHYRTISIVGTRKITEYGKGITQSLVKDLRVSNLIIISGLAHGVDSMAHKSCLLEEIPTIGVLGHGLDIIYPYENRNLADKMIHHGGLLTQFGIETKPDKENFPLRNRIVAALSDAVVVVETKKKGGSMITAEFANDYNKDVFAFPGRTYDEFSEGCNELIRLNKASIIQSAQDLLEVMQWDTEKSKLLAERRSELVFELEPDEHMVVEILDRDTKMHIDLLHKKLKFTPGALATILLNLEFRGVIKELPGKNYLLVS